MGRYMTTDEKLVDSFIALAEEFPNVYLDLSGVALVPNIEEADKRATGLLGSPRLAQN